MSADGHTAYIIGHAIGYALCFAVPVVVIVLRIRRRRRGL